ncbi:MAG: hypothetical protein ACFFCQ_09830 [Promethearchaeota archaeon]
MSQAVFNKDKFGVNQKHLAIGEKYFIRDIDTNEDLLWVERDRIGRYTHMHVYSDKSKQNKVLHLEDQATFDAFGKWTIIDVTTNEHLITLKRKFLKSWFWRESWDLFSPDGVQVGRIQSRGSFLATYLRKLGPLQGWLRLQFEVLLYHQRQEVKVMEYNRKLSLRDNYVIDCTFDADKILDRRIAVGLGLILDTSEAR